MSGFPTLPSQSHPACVSQSFPPPFCATSSMGTTVWTKAKPCAKTCTAVSCRRRPNALQPWGCHEPRVCETCCTGPPTDKGRPKSEGGGGEENRSPTKRIFCNPTNCLKNLSHRKTRQREALHGPCHSRRPARPLFHICLSFWLSVQRIMALEIETEKPKQRKSPSRGPTEVRQCTEGHPASILRLWTCLFSTNRSTVQHSTRRTSDDVLRALLRQCFRLRQTSDKRTFVGAPGPNAQRPGALQLPC